MDTAQGGEIFRERDLFRRKVLPELLNSIDS